MSELPPGWTTATINDLAVAGGVTDGPFGSNLKTAHYTPQGPRVIRLQNIGDAQFRDEYAHISPDHYEQLRKHAVEPADVLVASLGEQLPRACLAPPNISPAIVKADCIRIRTGAAATGVYLMWALNAPQTRDRVAESIKGVGRPRINLGDLRSLEIPVAPLGEQERIVAAIEEAFSKLDAGEAGLRTVRQRLKRMREAVLAAAVTGRLVPQDLTDIPAAKLLAGPGSEPHGDDELDDLPDGWYWSTLGEVSLSKGYGSSVKCGYDSTGVGVLRIPNVQRGRIDLVDLKRAPVGAISDDLMLAPGDLLIVRTNGSRDLIGRSAPVTRDTGCSFASYLIRFCLNSAVVDGEYVSLMLSSSAWRRRLEASAASSAGQYNVSLRTLEPMPVAVPPIAEQRKIVAEVDRQFSFIEACDRAIDAGLVRSAALRRSVLKAAFEGRLVSQDPSDEQASVLLERIRDQRLTAPSAKRRARQTA